MFLILFFLFFTTLLFWNFVWKRKGLPPGPIPLPIFGNAFSMNKSIYEQFQIWAKEYGPVYTIWIGEDPTVIVTDYEIMRDLFIKEGDVYAGRNFLADLFKTLSAIKDDYGGVIRTEGDPWKVVRRFGLQSMRNLGVGRAGLEKHLLEDMERFIEQIKEEISKNGGYNVNLQSKIDRLSGTTVNRVIFGYPFEDEHMSEFYELKKRMEEQAFLLSSLTGRMLMKQTPEEKGEPNDLLDCFLDQIEAEKSEYFSLKSITPFCFDLFLAGQETTSTTLSYLILYLILDQRVQSKMHEELDRLEEEKGRNGFDNSVTQADRGKLPFLNAVINVRGIEK
uniref:Uncharacterized protein n=1 Tax=Meloidogyne enterolobii TaxID=390850 RepID=A0A6V7UD55_MELEN|nr:unnamed protein product [Meloidogyne enterolobii]